MRDKADLGLFNQCNVSYLPVKLKLQVPLPGGPKIVDSVLGIRNLRITVFPGVGDKITLRKRGAEVVTRCLRSNYGM